MRLTVFALLVTWLFVGCSSKEKGAAPLFTALSSDRTGLQFSNKLTYSPAFNLFNYMYFYNGSGVGAGDFNNDGKIDLFFGSNQGQNTLYINDGDLRFRDVTAQAKIPADGGWTTGISVVDINNDGLLDIYVCRVGQYETLRGKNLFLINQGADHNGVPRFVDKAAEYGLDFSGFSTQAAFFDYDNDGDLDMYLLNHSIHQNNNFRPREMFSGTTDALSGDRIFRNNSPSIPFTDVTEQTGINSNSIGYGLGIVVSDLNNDGFPDLYIGNDFHENDYLYINQQNGTFRDESRERMMHTSQYSMGVDAADINNDAQPEIVSMDMLPSDPYILKRSLGEDTYDLFYEKIRMGYFYQFTRNNLQYNRGDGIFSETGLYSGIAATDWSWAPLWLDFDNDGLKDLFVSNGIPKRMNDIDYVNFVTTGEVQQKISANDMKGKDLSLIQKFPEIKIPNKFFRNGGNLSFVDEEARIGDDQPTFSNGAVYADFDNDGDLDVVVNNIDAPVTFYENSTNKQKDSAYLQIALKGPSNNVNAVGAKLVLFAADQIRTYEHSPAKGFLSSMQVPLHIGLRNTKVDSAFLIWPDRTAQKISFGQKQQSYTYGTGLPQFNFSTLLKRKETTVFAEDITAQAGLHFLHQENRFVEFDREPLIPHMVSTETPCTAVADINGDGLEDVFIGSAREQQSLVYLQDADGRFQRTTQPALFADSSYEDTYAVWADINRDNHPDLIVASGGNEFYGNDEHNTPRIYLNDGKGNLSKTVKPFGDVFLTASSIAVTDLNGDGYNDIFIGARAVPWAYGEIPQSHLFLNKGNGTFEDVTKQYSNELSSAGLITSAQWVDLDNDKDQDLLLSLEWGGIVAYLNEGKKLSRTVLFDKKGWWNFVKAVDVNSDGLPDLIAGNLGLNSRLKVTAEHPVRLYYNDFDGNGKNEQVLTYYVGGKEIPFATKAELEKQMPVLKKRFLYAEDLAKASLQDIFGKDKLQKADVLTADYMANTVLLNQGNFKFETSELPWQAQLTSFRDAAIMDANNDGRNDIFLVGNYYDSNIEMGHYDADYGSLLLNQGDGKFSYSNLNGLHVKGQVRRIQPINVKNQKAYLMARNNDSLKLLRIGRN